MVVKGDQEKIRALLKDTITLLCKNGLNYNAEFCIEALIGITLDKDDVFLVSINETVKNGLLEAKGADSDLEAVSVDAEHVVSHQPRKRRGPSMQPQHRGGTMTPRVKAEQHSDDDGQDIQENVDYSPHVDIATPPPGKRRRGPVERRPLVKQEHARGNSWGSAPQGQDDQTENNSFMATVGSGDAMGGVSEDADLSHVLHSGALVPLSGQTEDGANWTDTSMHSTSENVTDVNDPNQVVAGGVVDPAMSSAGGGGSSGMDDAVRLHGHHRLAPIPPTEKKLRPRRRCRVCYRQGRRRESAFYCQDCPSQPALCPEPCYNLYHSQRVYWCQYGNVGTGSPGEDSSYAMAPGGSGDDQRFGAEDSFGDDSRLAADSSFDDDRRKLAAGGFSEDHR